MKALIVLGNKLNDDESLTQKALKRCEITKKALKLFQPDKIILTGGIANEKTNVSEAKAMYNHLISDIDPSIFILEEKASTTTENAIYSLEICRKLNINEVIVISSIEHFGRTEPKNAILCFRDVIKDYPEITLSMYTEEY